MWVVITVARNTDCFPAWNLGTGTITGYETWDGTGTGINYLGKIKMKSCCCSMLSVPISLNQYYWGHCTELLVLGKFWHVTQ